MARRRIHIENLRIRLPRAMAGSACSLAGGLGREIMESIADASRGKTGAMQIDQISVENIKAAGAAADIQKRAAAGVSAEVNKRLG